VRGRRIFRGLQVSLIGVRQRREQRLEVGHSKRRTIRPKFLAASVADTVAPELRRPRLEVLMFRILRIFAAGGKLFMRSASNVETRLTTSLAACIIASGYTDKWWLQSWIT
jgi:hypothetical protein